MFTPDQWSTIHRITAWLDQNNGTSETEIGLRLLKLTEEAGEVAQAWIGTMGQNPRKGVTHTVAEVQDELIDVMVTAAVALTSLAENPATLVAEKLAKIEARSVAA